MAKIDLINTDRFKKILNILKEILNDERLDETIRKEYGDKLGEIINEHRK